MDAAFTSPTLTLAGYCLLALLGGVLPSLFKLTHSRLQIAVSFVVGLMLGLSLLGGFLTLFFLQRFLPFHHHDVAEGSPLEPCGHPHSLAERSARKLNRVGVALGLSLHSVFDGVALAAAVAAAANGHGALALGTALAVPRAGTSFGQCRVRPGDTGGALLFFVGAGEFIHTHGSVLGAALAFSAGTFLCIACADLLSELQFHKHDRFKL